MDGFRIGKKTQVVIDSNQTNYVFGTKLFGAFNF